MGNLSILSSKIEAIEERFAIGEINSDIYNKFKTKYETEQNDLTSNLNNSALSISNLQMAIDLALKISSNLSGLWASSDLHQQKKIQKLVFPSGIGYDKQNDIVQTNKVNALFSAIPLLSKEIQKQKNGEPININQFSETVTQTYESSNFLSSLKKLFSFKLFGK